MVEVPSCLSLHRRMGVLRVLVELQGRRGIVELQDHRIVLFQHRGARLTLHACGVRGARLLRNHLRIAH